MPSNGSYQYDYDVDLDDLPVLGCVFNRSNNHDKELRTSDIRSIQLRHSETSRPHDRRDVDTDHKNLEYFATTKSPYTMANPQNLRPVFSQEQLASSLRATHL